jgi:hypothetical protein
MSVLPGEAPLTIGLLRGLLRAPGLAIGDRVLMDVAAVCHVAPP